MAVLKKVVIATGSGDRSKSKKSASGGVSTGDKKREQSKQTELFTTHLQNAQTAHPNIAISGKAMTIMNSIVKDVYERIAAEAAKLSNYGKKSTHSA
ncbi:hypothetical protein WR25_09035 [Diploscapter pachys]|uniref:Core Histone H2A/H2B/H3 domain-containing protein n=1 Tax=Diploscapter pachys TaxID=2018661 RepID=A0A2A2K6J9_9BILA|nr:hypothetical protein WR25_09035 [Diploscapter pachys]